MLSASSSGRQASVAAAITFTTVSFGIDECSPVWCSSYSSAATIPIKIVKTMEKVKYAPPATELEFDLTNPRSSLNVALFATRNVNPQIVTPQNILFDYSRFAPRGTLPAPTSLTREKKVNVGCEQVVPEHVPPTAQHYEPTRKHQTDVPNLYKLHVKSPPKIPQISTVSPYGSLKHERKPIEKSLVAFHNFLAEHCIPYRSDEFE